MSFLYQTVAAELAEAIDGGLYPAGAKLPSIRAARDRFQVSVTTVIEAYSRLEDMGLVESRPKSGYYVRARQGDAREPAASRPPEDPGTVDVGRMVMYLCDVPRDPKVARFDTADPAHEAFELNVLSRALARTARTYPEQIAIYERTRGTEALCRDVARILVDKGCMVGEKDVVITNGAQEALFLALRAITQNGDIVAIESPTYFGILQVIEALNLKALELPTNPRSGIDLDALEQAAASGELAACVLTPTFQNPLGFCMEAADTRDAVGILSRHDVPLIENDVLGSLGFGLAGKSSAKSFDKNGMVLHCGSFSKTVSPALRLGWIVPGRAKDAVLQHKFLLNLTCATIPQLALSDFLSGNRFRRMTQAAAALYARRCQALRDAVLAHFPAGTKCTAPAGGLSLWVEMPRGYDSLALFKRGLGLGISLLPGDIFTRSALYQNCLRLTVGRVAEDRYDDCMRRLGALARSCRTGR